MPSLNPSYFILKILRGVVVVRCADEWRVRDKRGKRELRPGTEMEGEQGKSSGLQTRHETQNVKCTEIFTRPRTKQQYLGFFFFLQLHQNERNERAEQKSFVRISCCACGTVHRHMYTVDNASMFFLLLYYFWVFDASLLDTFFVNRFEMGADGRRRPSESGPRRYVQYSFFSEHLLLHVTSYARLGVPTVVLPGPDA